MIMTYLVFKQKGEKKIYDYPSCSPDCLENFGGCVMQNKCHQVPGRTYRVNGQCFKAITDCNGCLNNPTQHPNDLQQIDCDTGFFASFLFFCFFVYLFFFGTFFIKQMRSDSKKEYGSNRN